MNENIIILNKFMIIKSVFDLKINFKLKFLFETNFMIFQINF